MCTFDTFRLITHDFGCYIQCSIRSLNALSDGVTTIIIMELYEFVSVCGLCDSIIQFEAENALFGATERHPIFIRLRHLYHICFVSN